MTYEELLTLLLGWTGRRVQVAIVVGEPLVTIAILDGLLAGGEKLSDGGVDAVAVAFADATAGFLITAALLDGAGWDERDRATLVVRMGPVTLWIALEADQADIPPFERTSISTNPAAGPRA
ncbi:hypothetical protein OM076_22875 [Solirubrobacter ginsenosidimutans]|uniref:Uncharacterized protein n=1 Tax=Solirubrobacter ginsenosidimutans TaxID=490573 RepID=A0A9X3MWV6_9ACTN|nr:hypothetical protein [Solirubrobacter ginsenosidimutans]MDA0163136.1 hypothetical protein [Solirubrobacter ginsenosidimutans]